MSNKDYIELEEGQYLSSSLSEIPDNTNFKKAKPNIGATTIEILANRHSVIIVPNVPVIQGKVKEYPHLFGVYQGVSRRDVIAYLVRQRDSSSLMKLMCTPESFCKVKNACEKCGIDLYTDFFCLDDESHQLVKDSDYRPNISLPMDDFFRFQHKALVSATPLNFSDPRFAQQHFHDVELYIKGQKKVPINVVHTNELERTFSSFIDSHKENHVFIFCNSIDIPYSLLQSLNLLEQTSFFCSGNSKTKLKEEYGFDNAYSEWDSSRLTRICVFTARFFSAFDITIDVMPDIIMISDPTNMKQTVLDPHTDSIQIYGRCRNGVRSITHLFTTDSGITVKSEDEIKKEISAYETVYRTVQTLYRDAQTEEARRVYHDTLLTLKFRQWTLPDGNKNWFAIDNELYTHKVVSMYHDSKSLFTEYSKSTYFIPTFHDDVHGRKVQLKISSKRSSHTTHRRKNIVDILVGIGTPICNHEYNILQALRAEDSLIYEAYQTIGADKIAELEYKTRPIQRAMIIHSRRAASVIELVKHDFIVGKQYSNKEIVSILTRIYTECGIRSLRPLQPKQILSYFHSVPCSIRVKNAKTPVRGYRIISEAV